jgi:glutamate racemase
MKPHYDILVFDSGVGGLSIVHEIHQRLPGMSYLYVADNEAFPYGDKAEAWLEERVLRVMGQVTETYAVSMIVVACNTASTLVLPALRRRWSVPVVGVVPAVKPAALQSRTRAIGILATPATIDRLYLDQLILQFASDCRIVKVGTAELVKMTELSLRSQPISGARLRELTAPFFTGDEPCVDVVVLGCTHFPLLREELQRHVSAAVEWLDSGSAIARRIGSMLPLATKSHRQQNQNLALLTAEDPATAMLKPAFQRFGFSQLEVFHLAASRYSGD